MSATGVAIGAAAQAQATAAMIAAENARCTAVLTQPLMTTASVDEKRDYAGCIFRVHGSGEPMTEASAILLKLLIVVCFVGAGFGAWVGWRQEGGPFAVMGLVIGAMTAGCAAFVLFGAFHALRFLIS